MDIKNSEVDFSQYFNQKNESFRERKHQAEKAEGKNNRNKYFIALIAGNFVLGVLFFSYLISKSNELNSAAPVALENIGAPANYRVGTGETYSLPLP